MPAIFVSGWYVVENVQSCIVDIFIVTNSSIYMRSWRTSNGYEVFKVLGGRGNSYLIIAGKQAVLVDTGKQSAYKKLSRNIEVLLAGRHNIAFLILTHTHYDHCQNARKLQDREGCRVVVGQPEQVSAAEGYTCLPQGTNRMTRILSYLGSYIGRARFGYQPFMPDILVANAYDMSDFGLKIKLVKTAGHSAGSISVIVDDEIALVGDALFGVYRHSVLPPFSDSIPEMVGSWRKLLDSRCSVFLPGHGGEVSRIRLEEEYLKVARRYS